MEWLIAGVVVWIVYRVLTIGSRRHKYFMEAITWKTGGVLGVGTININKAVTLFKKASNLGHAQSSFSLGAIYADGWIHPTSSNGNDQIEPNEALSRAYFEKCHTQSPEVYIQLKSEREKMQEDVKEYLQDMMQIPKKSSDYNNGKNTFNL